MTRATTIENRSISRRRLLTLVGSGLAAAGLAGVPASGRAEAAPQPTMLPNSVSLRSARRRASGTITISTWGGRYTRSLRESFLDAFTKETGIEVQTVDAPGGFVPMLQAQAQAGNVSWDIVDVGESDSLYLLDNGLVQPLPADVKADLLGSAGEAHVVDQGISFAAFGWVIATNKKAAKQIPMTPANFFDIENFPGRRTMYGDDQATGVIYALQADGVPKDQLYPPDLDRAYRKLDTVKPAVAVWWRTGDQSQQIFRDEEVVTGLLWDGRAGGLIEQGVEIELAFEGSLISRDILVVPTQAPNPQGAFEFLRWYASHPAEGGKWIQATGYGVANLKAYEYVPLEIAKRSALFPPNFALGVPTNARWTSQNREMLVKRWTEWLSR